MNDVFARRVFRWSAVIGTVVLTPYYFLAPPAAGPEFYYGFVGVALAWQAAFYRIGGDPVRYRPMMPAAILAKALFSGAVFALYAQGRVDSIMLGAGVYDLCADVLFVVAYRRTPAA